jgi:tRNA dimethylallyltransferase
VNNKKTIVVIGGPTATGKTRVAIGLSKYYNTEIISADSRQCYCELKIGVARPSTEELSQTPHHFIATHSIHEKITAGTFEQYALNKSKEIWEKNDVVIMVGGTGLYIKAFCDGLDIIPGVPENVRKDISDKYKKRGLKWLQQEVEKKDPEFFKKEEVKNPHRLIRALEVHEATGHSILSFRTGQRNLRDFRIIKIALETPREKLYRQINARVDKMMDQGLVDEVKSLLQFKHLNPLKTVGYKELFAYLEKEIDLNQAIEEIKKNTRQYAKRQLTWFKKDASFHWVSADQYDAVFSYIATQMDKN